MIYVTYRLHIMRRDVYQAIADPTRRTILDLLAAQSLTLNGLAEHFEISRPAVSRHVKILAESDLVTIRKEGRERYCDPQFCKLDDVAHWIEQYRQTWEQRFNRLDDLLQEMQQNEL